MRREREIKRAIKPLCKALKINYDYFKFIEGPELLILNDERIECTGDTVEQIRNKVIAYIFVKYYCKNNSIGAFQKQTLNVIKKDWIKQKEEKYVTK